MLTIAVVHRESAKRLQLRRFLNIRSDRSIEFVSPMKPAETAPSTNCPQVCAGDLGLDSEKLEDRLAEILDLVARWKAILLLDEADVFLEARTRTYISEIVLSTWW